MRYLLGLASPAEREHVESEYFHDADAFQRMLSAEDDLIDAYVRGELSDQERRRFEQRFLKSSQGKDRVEFSRAFTRAVAPPVQTTRWYPLRVAAIAAAVVIAVILSWLVIERRRMSNESYRASDATPVVDTQKQFTAQEPGSPTPRKEIQSQVSRPKRPPITPAPQPEQKPVVNNEDVTLGGSFVNKKIVDLPLNASNVVNLLSLQPGVTRDGYVAGGRSEQANITLDGVDINEAAIKLRIALNSPVKYSDYRVSIETAGGRPVTSVDWSEPPKPNQTRVSSPAIKATDLPVGDYRVRLTGKDADGSFVQVAEYSLKVVVKK